MTAGGIVIGAHCSASGGLWRAAERAIAIGAEAVQLFGSSPRAWRQTQHQPEAFERFREVSAEAGLARAWLHGNYLANLAAPAEEQYERSIGSVIHALGVASGAGAAGVVLHTGSHLDAGLDAVLPRVLTAIERILDGSPDDATLALETSAGQGGTIGSFDDLGRILGEARSPRLRVCLDTCHVFAAGHDVRTPEGVAEMMERFDAAIGLDALVVAHANDSKGELGGNLDRHENIGDGQIGYEGFRALLGSPAFADKTFLLEVPGIENDGPDVENVRRLQGHPRRGRERVAGGESYEGRTSRGWLASARNSSSQCRISTSRCEVTPQRSPTGAPSSSSLTSSRSAIVRWSMAASSCSLRRATSNSKIASIISAETKPPNSSVSCSAIQLAHSSARFSSIATPRLSGGVAPASLVMRLLLRLPAPARLSGGPMAPPAPSPVRGRGRG